MTIRSDETGDIKSLVYKGDCQLDVKTFNCTEVSRGVLGLKLPATATAQIGRTTTTYRTFLGDFYRAQAYIALGDERVTHLGVTMSNAGSARTVDIMLYTITGAGALAVPVYRRGNEGIQKATISLGAGAAMAQYSVELDQPINLVAGQVYGLAITPSDTSQIVTACWGSNRGYYQAHQTVLPDDWSVGSTTSGSGELALFAEFTIPSSSRSGSSGIIGRIIR
jgi:hypothetical protein